MRRSTKYVNNLPYVHLISTKLAEFEQHLNNPKQTEELLR